MIIFILVSFLFGFYAGLTQNKTTMWKFWRKHPYLRIAFIISTMPFAFLFLLPLDWYQKGTTFKDYIETYKNTLK